MATFILIAVVGASVLWRESGWKKDTQSPQPQDPIHQAFDAMRDRDFGKYLDAHAGNMKASLRRAADEIGEARLLQSLQEQNAPLKGIAILEPERLSDREARLKVEYVFADRNEVQTYYLQKAGDAWKITRVDGAQRTQTLIPYGTPAN
jgi:hypothetical protein